MEKICSGYNGHAHTESADLFVRTNIASACSDCLALTELTQLCEPKCLYRESCPDKEGDPARRFTVLAKVDSPRVVRVGW